MSRVLGVCVVTGASRGVGLAIVKRLLRCEAVERVFACVRSTANAEDLCSISDPRLTVLAMDVLNDDSIKAAVQAVSQQVDHINVLFNNAGILENCGGSLPGACRSTWLRHFDTNVVAYAIVIQELLPLLQHSLTLQQTASIYNISGRMGSIANRDYTGRVPFGNIAYTASKAAVNQLSSQMAHFHPSILTLALCPGWVQTSMGGPDGTFLPEESAAKLIDTLESIGLERNGEFLNNEGKNILY